MRKRRSMAPGLRLPDALKKESHGSRHCKARHNRLMRSVVSVLELLLRVNPLLMADLMSYLAPCSNSGEHWAYAKVAVNRAAAVSANIIKRKGVNIAEVKGEGKERLETDRSQTQRAFIVPHARLDLGVFRIRPLSIRPPL